MNIFPYSNFHDLNLDWLLQKYQELNQKVEDITASAVPSTDNPLMDGVASPGTASNFARGDHRHPVDTSRASQSDLSDLDTRENDHYIELGGDINTVDAKIAFSTAAPLVDGVASPGSSDYLARADHVHPTDTSRASQTQVDTIQATLDAYAGSASPSDTVPLMDGVGAAGTGGNYSRADHVHPSDTSKLDVAGGTITGDLQVNGIITNPKRVRFIESEAIGWMRVASVPNVDGTRVRFTICRNGDSQPSETHSVELVINHNRGVEFVNENSVGDVNYVDKIRYSNAGKVDVHIDQSYLCDVIVAAEVAAPTLAECDAISMIAPTPVADAPAGESITTLHTFDVNTDDMITAVVYTKTWRFLKRGNVCMVIITQLLTPEMNVSTGYTDITTLPAGWRPSANMTFQCNDNTTIDQHIVINTAGLVRFYTNVAVTANRYASFAATWIAYQ